MKCPLQTRETAGLLAYSTRQEEASAEWQEHMESCSACRAFLTGQQAVWQALDAWEAPPVSPDFDRVMQRRIENECREPESWWIRLLHPSSALLRRGLSLAAAAVVLVVAGLMLDRPSTHPVSDRRPPQIESLQPEQVEHALDDLQMLSDFSSATRADAGEL